MFIDNGKGMSKRTIENKFLKFWEPKLVIWIESDIWPNMLKEIRNRKIDCYYINARISPHLCLNCCFNYYITNLAPCRGSSSINCVSCGGNFVFIRIFLLFAL